MNGNATELEQVFHTHRTSCQRAWPRGFGSLNPNPCSWILYIILYCTSVSMGYSPLSSVFTSATLQIHCTEVWHRTYPIYNAPLSRSARRSLTPLHKSHRNHRQYVWTEALSGIIFVPAQKLPGIVSVNMFIALVYSWCASKLFSCWGRRNHNKNIYLLTFVKTYYNMVGV